MKSRQIKKNSSNTSHNSNQEAENESQSALIARSLCHLNRSLRQFSEGLQSRMWTLQERLVLDRLEAAAWTMSQRVRKIQNRVFDVIDNRISKIEDKRARKLDYQTALERFDGEGGAMIATNAADAELPKSVTPPPKQAGKGGGKSSRPSKSSDRSLSPGLDH